MAVEIQESIILAFSNIFASCFYLPPMEHEGSIGLLTGKMKKKKLL
jgi:hypothetical protein